MPWPTQAQVFSGLRSAGVALGTVFTVLGTLGAISPDAASAIVAQLQLVGDDLHQLVGDGWKLGLLLAPIVTVWLAKLGMNAQSNKSLVAKVQALPDAQVIVTDPKLAQGIPGVKVEELPSLIGIGNG
jgi:hypothetical protein